MCVHVFGNSPSPSVANYGLRKTVENAEPDVKKFVQRDSYVDDGLVSLPSAEGVISLIKRTQEVLKTEGNLRLHKIASNSTQVMKAFSPDDLAKDLKCLEIRPLPLQRSLGLVWDLNTDNFTFNITLEDKPFTRRGSLSNINSIYDPLGFLAPITIQGKILLRDCMDTSGDWDDELPQDKLDEWKFWKSSLKVLEDVHIPRAYIPVSITGDMSIQLHVYSDASEQAIASCAYLTMTNEKKETHTGFVFGKAKVAPFRGHTIPRLELCAAVLSVEIADLVCENLDIVFSEVKFYTDSRVVLGYICNDTRRFYTYVSNRVDRIRRSSSPSQWNYVSTIENPADSATRISLHGDIKAKLSTWIHGPELQNMSDVESETNNDLVNPDLDKEIRPEVNVLKSHASHFETVGNLGCYRFTRFSSWSHLVKALSLLRSYINNSCSVNQSQTPKSDIHTYIETERFIVREVQHELFANDIFCLESGKKLDKNSPIRQLNPYLDKDHLLRVGGRLNKSDFDMAERNPLIIPSKCHIAKLLVMHYHETVQHQGRHFTEGAIRSNGYWIVGAKRLVSSILYKCVICRKSRGRTMTQLMSDLPEDRLRPGPPFTSVGVDTFGPYTVVSRRTRGGQLNNKRWALLFTCLTTRAIHIEVIEELSSSSFINALRRFIAIRGNVKVFRSDRGTNFIGSTEDLGIKSVRVEDGPVHEFLQKSRCEWKFNVPHSSHMGGIWERLIGVTRRILDSMLLNVKGNLTHEVLVTLVMFIDSSFQSVIVCDIAFSKSFKN